MRIVRAIYNRLVRAWQNTLCFYAKHFMKAPKVLCYDETLDLIINEHYSISRNGDGELNIMMGRSIPFQKKDERLSRILREAHSAIMPKYMSAVPDIFGDLAGKSEGARRYWINFMRVNRFAWYKLAKAPFYGDATVTRFYLSKTDKRDATRQIERIKQIWKKQDVVLVEGKESKLGVNNDLFAGARRVRRILGPTENAFSVYDQLMDCVKKEASKDSLVLLALGPTATAMAYELAKEGYWAVDIGHIDIEYEWYLMGATSKVNVPGKYTNESTGAKVVGTLPEQAIKQYKEQIIAELV